jgi:hypothetical protein
VLNMYIDVWVLLHVYINILNIVEAHRHLGLTSASSTVKSQAANQINLHCRYACQVCWLLVVADADVVDKADAAHGAPPPRRNVAPPGGIKHE